MGSPKTTDQMDGLFTVRDIARKNSAYIQCRQCSKWTPIDIRRSHNICNNCGANDFDLQSTTSERTFNPKNRRKIKS